MLQPKLVSIKPMSGYKLSLEYETGERRTFDVSAYLKGAWYSQLKDISYFNTVRLLPEGVGIEWPDGQDVAPHELYELSV